jgi:integrase
MTTKKPNYSTFVKMPKHPHFYQNPDSKKIIYIKWISGKRVKIACKTTSITEAKAFIELELIRLFSNKPKEDIRQKKGIINPTLTEIWSDLMDEKRVESEESTMKGYTSSWVYGIEPFWGKLTPSDVNDLMVTRYEHWYLQKNPERVFFNTEKHLGMLFRYMVKQGIINKAPPIRHLDEIIVKRTKKLKVGRVYTDEEIKDLLEHAVTNYTKLAIMIYRYMGCRKMELLKSERSKWDLKTKVALIWSYKNKKWREVPIPDQVVSELQKHLKSEPESKYLFCAATDPERHISSQVFDKAWTKTKVDAKLARATDAMAARVHDLRHTFATWTALSNWPITLACKVLDMSVEEYSRTYVHISNDDVRSKMNVAGAVLR